MSRPINFTDTIITKKPYVEINGNEYEVQDGTYQGGTDLNANTFNKMQDELNMFRNLLNIIDGNYTHNGVTYVAKNGILTYSSGTPTGDVNMTLNITPITLKKGTYTMSNNSGNYPYIILYNGNTQVVRSEYANNGVKTFAIENETIINKINLYFGTTIPSTVSPQLEEGTKKSDFTSWAGYIEESGFNANCSWVKYNDGTINYYGILTALANNNNASIDLTIPFVNDNYVVTANTKYQSDANALNYLKLITTPNTNLKNKITIYNVYPDGTIPTFERKIYFNAKGKWK